MLSRGLFNVAPLQGSWRREERNRETEGRERAGRAEIEAALGLFVSRIARGLRRTVTRPATAAAALQVPRRAAIAALTRCPPRAIALAPATSQAAAPPAARQLLHRPPRSEVIRGAEVGMMISSKMGIFGGHLIVHPKVCCGMDYGIIMHKMGGKSDQPHCVHPHCASKVVKGPTASMIITCTLQCISKTTTAECCVSHGPSAHVPLPSPPMLRLMVRVCSTDDTRHVEERRPAQNGVGGGEGRGAGAPASRPADSASCPHRPGRQHRRACSRTSWPKGPRRNWRLTAAVPFASPPRRCPRLSCPHHHHLYHHHHLHHHHPPPRTAAHGRCRRLACGRTTRLQGRRLRIGSPSAPSSAPSPRLPAQPISLETPRRLRFSQGVS